MTASIADWAKHMHLCTQTLGRIKMKVRCEQEIESQLKIKSHFPPWHGDVKQFSLHKNYLGN